MEIRSSLIAKKYNTFQQRLFFSSFSCVRKYFHFSRVATSWRIRKMRISIEITNKTQKSFVLLIYYWPFYQKTFVNPVDSRSTPCTPILLFNAHAAEPFCVSKQCRPTSKQSENDELVLQCPAVDGNLFKRFYNVTKLTKIQAAYTLTTMKCEMLQQARWF